MENSINELLNSRHGANIFAKTIIVLGIQFCLYVCFNLAKSMCLYQRKHNGNVYWEQGKIAWLWDKISSYSVGCGSVILTLLLLIGASIGLEKIQLGENIVTGFILATLASLAGCKSAYKIADIEEYVDKSPDH